LDLSLLFSMRLWRRFFMKIKPKNPIVVLMEVEKIEVIKQDVDIRHIPKGTKE